MSKFASLGEDNEIIMMHYITMSPHEFLINIWENQSLHIWQPKVAIPIGALYDFFTIMNHIFSPLQYLNIEDLWFFFLLFHEFSISNCIFHTLQFDTQLTEFHSLD
ncbi:hypothetical protein ACJX0J_013581 [Zea mays]